MSAVSKGRAVLAARQQRMQAFWAFAVHGSDLHRRLARQLARLARQRLQHGRVLAQLGQAFLQRDAAVPGRLEKHRIHQRHAGHHRAVPTTQPAKAHTRLPGLAATSKPCHTASISAMPATLPARQCPVPG